MFTDYLSSFLTLAVIQILGVMSPGPDFAVVMRNSLVFSRKVGIFTAIGAAFGTLVHISYILLGVGTIIAKTEWLFLTFKYCGAGYLIYIGIKGLMTKKSKIPMGSDISHQPPISASKGLSIGFFTNVANPKAMLFFLSLFSAFITPSKPNIVIFIYALIIVFTTMIWFIFVALCFSNHKLQTFFYSYKHIVEWLTCSMLILLGIKILFTNVSI